MVQRAVASGRAVRTDKWRYIEWSDGGQELYDMTRDYGNENNLAGKAESREVIAQLKPLLKPAK